MRLGDTETLPADPAPPAPRGVVPAKSLTEVRIHPTLADGCPSRQTGCSGPYPIWVPTHTPISLAANLPSSILPSIQARESNRVTKY